MKTSKFGNRNYFVCDHNEQVSCDSGINSFTCMLNETSHFGNNRECVA